MNVPKLRFKEFNAEYKSIKLKDVSEIYDGTHETPNYVEKGVKFVSVENISNLLDTTKFIPESDYNKYKIKPKYNDVFMTRIGDIGTSSIYKSDEKLAYYVSLALLRTKDNHILIPDYLNQYIKNNSFQKELHNRTIHVAFPKKINTGEIGECSINLCSDKEQLKVSNLLSLLDKKIELQTKKIEDLKLFKLYLQNKLYNANDTKDVLIKDLGEIVTGTTPSKSENKYWDNGNILWITPTDICENRDINDCSCKLTESGLAKGRFIPKNSILVTCIASIGKNAIIKEDGSCNQQINAIIPSKDYNYNYIYYMIENLSNYMKSIAGTSATAIINKEQFGNINIKIHKREVQDKISKILNAFETKIIQEGFKYKKLQNLKKGLMQNMFV